MFNERNLSLLMLMLFMNLPLCLLLNLPRLPGALRHCPLVPLSVPHSIRIPAAAVSRSRQELTRVPRLVRFADVFQIDEVATGMLHENENGVVAFLPLLPLHPAGVNCVIAECCFPMFN